MATTRHISLAVAAALAFGLAATTDRGLAGAAPRDAVPILMFHAIGDGRGTPLPELYDAPETFRAQLAWLAAHGFHAVTLDDVYLHWVAGRTLPRKPVVLTFDDGYPGDVDVALPALRALRWVGVLNLQVDNLVPARVRRLIDAGWEVDSHTFTHPDLTTITDRALVREIATSRAWIHGVLKVPVRFFCYPSGRFDARVVAAVRRAGYVGATTTIEGLASPADGLWTLHRIRVDGSDGVDGLAGKLSP
jgi:peptidoglycan/xylan/chitin deacetylase (PgdA/CDA1 family)